MRYILFLIQLGYLTVISGYNLDGWVSTPRRGKFMNIQSVPGERSIFWEVIVSVILRKILYMYMCPIPNLFRDRAISLYRRATRHVLTRVAKCIEVEVKFSKMYYTR
jgi:hypothetical protein